MRENVLRSVFEHAQFVDSYIKMNDHGQRIFTALYGSQNYNLDTEYSDVDTKSFFIPSFPRLLFSKEPLSKTLTMLNRKEYSELKDVRLLTPILLKQGVNFLETLFTPYIDIAIGYEDFYFNLISMREEIVHYDGERAIVSMCAQARQQCITAFSESAYSSYEYNAKKIASAYRMVRQAERYAQGYSFSEVLDGSSYRDTYLNIKNSGLSLKEARNFAADLYAKSSQLQANYEAPEIDRGVQKKLEALVEELAKEEYRIMRERS